MVFINEYIIDFSLYIWSTLSTWLIYCYYALKINKCCVCYLRTGCKKLLGKVRKIGKSVHTLIHPPSQCGCCVQHLWYIPTDEQIADVLTKPLSKTMFENFRDKLGVVENASLAEREC